MKCAARLPLTFALGLIPLPGYGGSRDMAAQIDSEQSRGERTLYLREYLDRGGFPMVDDSHWRGIHDEDGRLTVAINYLLYSMSH